MAATTTNETSRASSAIANTEVRVAFSEHAHELTWLAEFLTNDELLAHACVTDAGTTDQDQEDLPDLSLGSWPREATIRSAVDFKRKRIAELSWYYEHGVCCRPPRPLSQETLEFVVSESEAVRLQLDSLCRFVLVACGIERHSSDQAARLLGISKHAVDVAYSRALQSLEVMYCQAFIASQGCVAA